MSKRLQEEVTVLKNEKAGLAAEAAARNAELREARLKLRRLEAEQPFKSGEIPQSYLGSSLQKCIAEAPSCTNVGDPP